MAFIEWSEDYATGVPDIDKEHQMLFALINDLHDRVKSNSAETAIGSTIDALVDYVDYHFAREESLMELCHYPDIEEHMLKHRKLQDQMDTYRQWYANRPGEFDMDNFMAFLSDWLQSHIQKTDMAYVPSVKTYVDRIVDDSDYSVI